MVVYVVFLVIRNKKELKKIFRTKESANEFVRKNSMLDYIVKEYEVEE